ncbi:hypothetical protein [Kitasatospora camelliae]|uniref:Uncharacterized protein n=1 Tax=Kitasatospora camelliae TaxID=3156397 RepID=A0AAU8K2N6_9ACTN
MPTPNRRASARAAMIAVAEAQDIPVTVRQVEALLAAAESALLTWVDATPTQQALYELRAAGWTLPYLAARLGTSSAEIGQRMRRRHVTPRVEEQTLRLAAELKDVDPVSAGLSQSAVRMARTWASRRTQVGVHR